MAYAYKVIGSPVGKLKLVASEKGLAAILWEKENPRRVPLEVERQLGEYFGGRLRRFAVPLDFNGTEFQKSVWQALLTIPFGETRSYGAIAEQIGRPDAPRAVGAANGRNPISIIAPCHRVVGSSGKLTGFAGGLEAKQYLLGLEGRKTPQSREGRTVKEENRSRWLAAGA
jgi:methylated-DNA-[protein]-cysteine S-methyltransferase